MKFLTQKVQEHYARDRVLADFGIRIIGAVGYTSEIPGYIDGTYGGQKFGDAYLISPTLSPPWDTLVWTRRTASSTVEDGIWIDLGDLAIPGPQGIQGEQGLPGPRGDASEWYTGGDQLPSGDFTAGDMTLLSDGAVYRYNGQDWRYVTNIRGPQGIRGLTGPPGPQGEPGGPGPAGPVGPPASAIRILGALTAVDYLPDPSTLSQADGVPAYLIVVGSETRLYYIQGAAGAENWGYIPFTGQGTIVTTNGVALSTWDTNTKVDKTNSSYKIYGTDEQGNQTTLSWGFGVSTNQMVRRTSLGNIIVPETPLGDQYATSKKYVDDLAATKVTTTSSASKVYGTDSSGNQTTYNAQQDVSWGPGAIPLRVSYGNILVPEATGEGVREADRNKCAASRKYVDDAIGTVPTVTKVVTFPGTYAAFTSFSISDLPGIIPNTRIDIVAHISTTGIIQGPPSTAFDIGSNSIAYSSDYDVPIFTNNLTRYSCSLYQNGSQFFVQRLTDSWPTAASGDTIRMGVTDGNGGQTSITVTYLATR